MESDDGSQVEDVEDTKGVKDNDEAQAEDVADTEGVDSDVVKEVEDKEVAEDAEDLISDVSKFCME